MFYIYILQSLTSHIYCSGYSDDPWRRVIEHNTKLFNTFTSKHRPWCLAAAFECSENESEAVRVERFIKRQKSRRLLEKLINPAFTPTGILAQLVIPIIIGTARAGLIRGSSRTCGKGGAALRGWQEC